MSCQVIKNDLGKITRVNNKDGAESTLFNSIASHPLVKDTDTALAIFKNAYLTEIGEDSEWIHKVGDTFTDNYRTALQEAVIGQEIGIGFTNSKGNFYPIMTTVSNTNKDTYEGFLNFQIKNGILSQKKSKLGGEYKFQAAGENITAQTINAELLEQDAKRYLGKEGVKRDDINFELEKTIGTLKIENKNGTSQRVSYADIDQMEYSEMQSKFNDPELILLDKELYKNQSAYRDTKFEGIPTRSERELQISLLNLMSKLGVRTLPISQYISKYETKNGVAPSATALADIANQIIAYTEGKISLNDLTEESSHFIVEAMPKEQTENILRNIHRTEEWVQFSDQYRELYRKDHKSEDLLEEAVRREVLGKVVAKSIKENFTTENKTTTQTSIINKIKELLESFFENLRSLFNPTYRTELDAYLADIDIIVAKQDTDQLNTDNFKHNKFRLYSAEPVPQLTNSVRKVVAGLEQQVRALSKESATTSIDRNKLKRVEENLANAQSLQAVTQIVGMARSSIKYLNNAIEDSKKNNKSYIFSSEENTVFQSLKGLVGSSLEELGELTKEPSLRKAKLIGENEAYKNWEIVNKEISNTIDDLSTLKGKASISRNQNIERIIDEMVNKYNFDDKVRDNLLKWAENAESDTNYMHATFGQLAHAKDGMLRTVGYLLRKMHTQAHTNYVIPTQKLQKGLRDLSFDETFFKEQMLDGDQILNEFDLPKLNNALDNIYVETYKKITGSQLSDKDILAKKDKGELDFENLDQETEVVQQYRTATQPLRERAMKDSYYEKYEKILDKANLQDITKTRLKDYVSGLSVIKRKARKKDGVLDYSSLSKADREKMREITEQRQTDKNIYDETGQLKNGLEYLTGETGARLLDDKGVPMVTLSENPSNQAIVAYDINNLDRIFAEENKEKNAEKKEMPTKFLDELSKIERESGKEEAFDFLMSNSYVAMSQDFWDSLDINNSDTLLGRTKNVDVDLYNEMVEQKSIIKNLLKQNASKNRPSEVDGEIMSQTSKQAIKDAQQTLESLYKTAKEIVPNSTEEFVDSGLTRLANESYRTELSSMGIENAEDEISFAENHMTDSNKVEVRRDFHTIDAYTKGVRGLSTRLQETYDNFSKQSSLTEQELVEKLKQKVIRDRLLPYYQSYSTAEYRLFFDQLKNSTENSIVEILKGKSSDIEVQPNYSFFNEEENDEVNPNYDPEYKGGFFQPKKGNIDINGKTYNFENQKWKEFSKDENKMKAYDLVMDWYKEGLEAGGILSPGYNLYQKPQIRRGTMERVNSLIKDPKSMGMMFKELTTYTEDDIIKGQRLGGAQLIPKRYVYKLDDPEDVSNELFYSMNAIVSESYLRKARLDSYGDVMSVYDTVSDSTRYNSIDKRAEATSSYKMVKSAIEQGIFNISETVTYETTIPFINKKVDLTRIAKQIISFVKARNLALNPIIAATSALTGAATKRVEEAVGQFIEPRSQSLGRKEWRNIVGDGMKDFGKIHTDAKINVLGQTFGAFDVKETFKNSNYGFLGRLAPKLGMGMHTMANYNLYGKTLMGILHDFRIVDGKITKWYDYRQLQRNEGKTDKEIKSQWKTMEDKVIYNYMDVDNGVFKLKEEALNKEVEDFDSLNLIDVVRGHVQAVNERTDGQLNEDDRSLANRTYYLSFLTVHRGWLQLALQHRFASKTENFNTGQMQSGSYTSLGAFVKNYADTIRKDGLSNIIKAFKTTYDKSDQVDKENLKRVGIEIAALQVILLLYLGISGFGDEEDDPFAAKLAVLLANRTANELASVQSYGLGNSLFESVKEPFIGLGLLANISELSEAVSGEEITRGKYKDYNKSQRYFIRAVPGLKTGIIDLPNLAQTNATYKYYNGDNTNNALNPIYYFASKFTEK